MEGGHIQNTLPRVCKNMAQLSVRMAAKRTTTGAGAVCTSRPGAMQHTHGARTVLTAGTGTTYTPTGAGTANAARAGALPFTVGSSCCTYCGSPTSVLHHTYVAPSVKVAATTVSFSGRTDQEFFEDS